MSKGSGRRSPHQKNGPHPDKYRHLAPPPEEVQKLLSQSRQPTQIPVDLQEVPESEERDDNT